jgi:hypothetical protein
MRPGHHSPCYGRGGDGAARHLSALFRVLGARGEPSHRIRSARETDQFHAFLPPKTDRLPDRAGLHPRTVFPRNIM